MRSTRGVLVLLFVLVSRGIARSRHFRHSQKEHISQKETKKQGGGAHERSLDFAVPGMMDGGPNLGGGIPGLGPSMGDPNMAFNAGVTSMGEGGGATMEGMPGMPGMPVMPEGGGPGPMAMAGSPMGMSLPAGGMEMPNMAGPAGEEPNLMSKQFIEGGGGMGGGMSELGGMQGMGGMGGMGGMQGMQGMGGMGGMGGMPSFGAMGGSMGGGMGGIPGMNNFASMGGVNTAMGGGLASMAAMEGMGGGMGGGGMMTGAQELASVEGPQRREKLSKVHRAFSKRKHHHKE